MAVINPTLPTVGDSRGPEEVDIRNALSVLLGEFNGNIDAANLKDLGVTPAKLAAAVAIVPVGCVLPFAGAVVPTGWLRCDGAAVSQSVYAALFAAIGHTYGPDPGGGNFLLPDLRGRVAVGVGTAAEIDARGKSDGIAATPAAELAKRKPKHRHGRGSLNVVSDGTHQHTVGGGVGFVGTGAAGGAANITFGGGTYRIHGATDMGGGHSHGLGGEIGDGTGPLDGPAFVALDQIIRT